MRRSLQRPILLAVAVVVLAVLLYKFRDSITIAGFRWSVLATSIREANLLLLLLALVAIYACYAIRTLRWNRIATYLGKSDFWRVYAATLMGFASVFLLGRAGEPIRPLLIARKENQPITGIFGVYFLERILDVGATAVFAGFALLAVSHGPLASEQGTPLMHAVRRSGAALLIGFAVVVVFLIYFRLHGAGALARRLELSVLENRERSAFRAKIAALVAGFSEGLHALRTWGDLAAAIGWSAAHWILVVMVYLWIGHAFGGALSTLTFSGAMLILAITLVGSAVQLPGVGGGAQVANFLVLTVVFGVEKEPAAAVTITTWLITFAACSLAGVPLLLREGWSMGELKRAARAEEHADVVKAEEDLIREAEAKEGSEATANGNKNATGNSTTGDSRR
jgi:uncharacterized protein (TIRG00374 family)